MNKILLTLVIAVAASSVGAQEQLGQEGYVIAYNVAVDTEKDDYDVWVMNPEGSGKKNITNHPDVAWTYTSSGSDLYFISDRGAPKRNYYLYRTNAAGDPPVKVSELRLEDSWMSFRNGGTEAVVTGRIGDDVRYQLFIIDLKTGKYSQMTAEPGAFHRDPVFSPDGKWLAVEMYNKDNTEFGIYLMNFDTKEIRKLTDPKDFKYQQAPVWVKKP